MSCILQVVLTFLYSRCFAVDSHSQRLKLQLFGMIEMLHMLIILSIVIVVLVTGVFVC